MPDAFLKKADQVVNLDLSVEDLIDRLKSGKIYAPDKVSHALENFFTRENLTRLRERTLTEIAHLIDRRGRKVSDAYQAPGHGILPFSGAHEHHHPLLRTSTGTSSRSP